MTGGGWMVGRTGGAAGRGGGCGAITCAGSGSAGAGSAGAGADGVGSGEGAAGALPGVADTEGIGVAAGTVALLRAGDDGAGGSCGAPPQAASTRLAPSNSAPAPTYIVFMPYPFSCPMRIVGSEYQDDAAPATVHRRHAHAPQRRRGSRAARSSRPS